MRMPSKIVKMMTAAGSCKPERPHGHWEKQVDGTHFCSYCGRDATYNFDGWEVLGVSCTYCDAKMDQEDAHGQN